MFDTSLAPHNFGRGMTANWLTSMFTPALYNYRRGSCDQGSGRCEPSRNTLNARGVPMARGLPGNDSERRARVGSTVVLVQHSQDF